jgi:hypothetical protein
MRSLAEVLCPNYQAHTCCNQPKVHGSKVMVGTNLGPIYEVVHVAGQTAWIRPLQNGIEGLASVANLRVVNPAPDCELAWVI